MSPMYRKFSADAFLKVPEQEIARTALKKYLVAEVGDVTAEDIKRRVAKKLASNEQGGIPGHDAENYWAAEFERVLGRAFGGGRIMSNAGAERVRGSVSLINCIVLSDIDDSMDGIFRSLHQNAMLLKYGCGTGMDWSSLRPDGATVGGAGAKTNGPLAFMDVFDTACKTVSSAGGRRGAMMGTLSVSHPDVFSFIKAKRTDGRLRSYNLSILVTDAFMHAVAKDLPWDLSFKGKVYQTVQAREVWRAIMESNWNFSEPGMVFVDRMNEMNNLWFCERINATNPCGEQGLPADGACLLGSMDVSKYVAYPFDENAELDWGALDQDVEVFTRMLDNVVEYSNLPSPSHVTAILRTRRHGTGFTGLGSAMAMLGIRYGSQESADFTEKVAKRIAYATYRAGAALAVEKGMAPVLEEKFTLSMEQAIRLRDPKLRNAREVRGLDLWLESKYFDVFREDEEGRAILRSLANNGCRFTHGTSVAPTGTTSLAFCNNTSSGVEPTFEHRYYRNVTKEDNGIKDQQEVFSYELLAYKVWCEQKGKTFDPENLPECFISANDVSPEGHIAVQAAAQKWVDSSISKTINVPTGVSVETYDALYLTAYKAGLKGCCTFRYNPSFSQGILIREEDLRSMSYRFTLEDGSVVEERGDHSVEYMGKTYNVANLAEAVKEKKI